MVCDGVVGSVGVVAWWVRDTPYPYPPGCCCCCCCLGVAGPVWWFVGVVAEVGMVGVWGPGGMVAEVGVVGVVGVRGM